MGEYSIIEPETRVIDRESESRVFSCHLVRDLTADGLPSSAGGVRRRKTVYIDENKFFVGVDIVDLNKCKNNNNKNKKINLRKRVNNKNSQKILRTFTTTFLFEKIVLLFLSFFDVVQRYSSSVSTSRGLVSSSCYALVSLIVVGLLRPTFAVPTNNVAAANYYYNSRNGDMTLTKIMAQQRQLGYNVNNKDEETKFDNGVEVTMSTTRLEVEKVTKEYDDYYDDDDDDDGDVNGQDSVLTPVLQHRREFRLESRSRLREPELDTIRRSIVEGLGLERIPDPSKANVSQTEYRRAHQEYLTRIHSRAGKGDRLRRLYTFHAAERLPSALVNRTRRSLYSLSKNDNDLMPSNNQSGSIYFPLKIPEDDTLVDHATLRLLVDPSGTSIHEESHVISLYRLTADSRHFVSRQNFLPGEKGPRWIEIDATEIASLWHEYGIENFGVQIVFEKSNDGKVTVQPKFLQPALNIFTTKFSLDDNDFRNSRRKRRASPEHLMSLHKGRRTECRGENKKCCRHQMTVIFKDLEGFEFIVQPKSFDAGYCKGRCPPRYNPAHHHALLQSLIWKEDKRKAPRPCCAPSKLDELEILYFDENDPTKLKVSSWKNMKVLECACS